ncbi:MAG: ATP-dependent 6-phosphofructokinase [Eubacteriales bacterium]
MSNSIKRIGVLTSGGDAPGMNAAVRSVVRSAISSGLSVVGIRRGWNGLINSDFSVMDHNSVSHIIHRGGTILYTARSMEFMTEAGQIRAVDTCRMLGLDGVVAIGGDGTFRGAQALSARGIPVIGIPATIDNDVGCSHYTIGFDSACNSAIHCIDMLRDTMQSHERCSVVEVMGRHAGNLALYVGISIGATAVLIPEREGRFEQDVLDKIRNARLAGSTNFMVVVAEGAGNSFDIAKKIEEAFGIVPCVTVLGHIQRGGSPTARDREVASRMGYNAVKCLVEGRTNRIIATMDGQLVDLEINEALEMKKKFQMDRYDILESITRSIPIPM